MTLRILVLAAALLLAPQAVRADYLDVITIELDDDCSLDQYTSIVQEFRALMKQEGYKYTVELVIPFTGDELDVLYWVGRTPDLATFGAESARWEAALAKGDTPEAKWNEKSEECGENQSRAGSFTR